MDRYEALKLERQVCFPLYAASREVIKYYRSYLDPLGLTYTQYIAMMVLWEENCISSKEMGKRLYLDSGTLTPLLKGLETKGLVTRRRSEMDERVLLVELTEAGEAMKEEAVTVPERLMNCGLLSLEDSRELHRLLYKLLDKFDD